MPLNSTPRTWVSGEVVTAAEMNAEIRDAFNGVQSAWTSYTPTLGGITLGNGTLLFKYQRYGKTVTVRGKFAAGSTTSFSAASLTFSLPVTPHADYTGSADVHALGGAIVQPAAAGTRWAAVPLVNSAGPGVVQFLAASGANAIVTNLVPATFTASSAVISFTVEYEAA